MTRESEREEMMAEALENEKTRVMIVKEEGVFNEETREYDVVEVEMGLGRSKWFREFVEKLRTCIPGDNDYSIGGDCGQRRAELGEDDMEYLYQEYHFLRDSMRSLGYHQIGDTPIGDDAPSRYSNDGTEANPNLHEANALQRLWRAWIGPFNEAQKAMRTLKKVNERCCPECGSDLIESDGEAEADGCAQDWAEWLYWSSWCNETECDWSDSGTELLRSGGSF